VLDQVPTAAVVLLPTLFAVGIEVVSKEIKELPYFRVVVVAFGVGLSVLTWFQMSRSDKTAKAERKSAISETATNVTANIGSALTKALEDYNRAHPQQQIRPELLTELTRAVKQNPVPVQPPTPVEIPLSSLSNMQLKERAISIANRIDAVVGPVENLTRALEVGSPESNARRLKVLADFNNAENTQLFADGNSVAEAVQTRLGRGYEIADAPWFGFGNLERSVIHTELLRKMAAKLQ